MHNYGTSPFMRAHELLPNGTDEQISKEILVQRKLYALHRSEIRFLKSLYSEQYILQGQQLATIPIREKSLKSS